MAEAFITGMTAAAPLAGYEPVEVPQFSTTVDIAATTISALASDNSFNDSANGFVAAGFAVNDRVNVAGFTGNVANNLYAGIVTALAAGKMTIGGADGNVIVDDAAGELVSIVKWETHRTTTQDIADLAGSANTRPISFFFTTTPTATEVLLLYTALENITLADEFAGSVGDCGTNPTSSFVLDVQKNGSSVGTITISTGGVFTFVTTGAAVSLVSGDQVKVVGPATPDATCANVSISLKGTI